MNYDIYIFFVRISLHDDVRQLIRRIGKTNLSDIYTHLQVLISFEAMLEKKDRACDQSGITRVSRKVVLLPGLRDERDAVETIYGLWRNKIYRGYQGNVTKIAVERKRDAHRQAYYVGELANESESGEREGKISGLQTTARRNQEREREKERKHERKEQDE